MEAYRQEEELARAPTSHDVGTPPILRCKLERGVSDYFLHIYLFLSF